MMLSEVNFHNYNCIFCRGHYQLWDIMNEIIYLHSSSENLKKLKLPSLKYRRFKGDVVEVDKSFGAHEDK